MSLLPMRGIRAATQPEQGRLLINRLASATELGCDGAQRMSALAVIPAQDAHFALAPGPIWWGHFVDA